MRRPTQRSSWLKGMSSGLSFHVPSLSWAVILTLFTYCFSRTLKGGS